MHSGHQRYTHISENGQEQREDTPWYWRFVALTASWMIVAGYLLLPGLYANDSQLKFSTAVLSVFVVALLTAGYASTALLCFACRDASFQAFHVFLPTVASSALGLISIAFNLFATRAYHWSNASTTGTVISGSAILVYGALLVWRTRRIYRSRKRPSPRPSPYSEPTFYTNYNQNMYPTATNVSSHTDETTAYNEDDPLKRNMASLLTKLDLTPSPHASATFQIAMPRNEEQERRDQSQELVGTPGAVYEDVTRGRADSRPDSLGEHQAWERWQERGRQAVRPSSTGGRSSHSRNISREERRTEIELGALSRNRA